MTIAHLQPTALWKQFQNLCNIPRPSKHEEQAVQYCKDFADKNSLKWEQDEIGNLLIFKPATKGLEHLKTVVMQSHLDMVPQKNADTDHDFKTDPIQAYVDGEWVTAKGTTLGADNGLGVAAILAVFESTDIEHGPLEALLTIDEEAGMTGAMNLKENWSKGDILFNLDTEDEGELYVGCAGGIDVSAEFDIQWADTPDNHQGILLSVTGLQGGHSGVDIHRGLGNANKITNRMLRQLLKSFDIKVASFLGGSLRNAIPREAFTQITVANDQVDLLSTAVKDLEAVIKQELAIIEPGLSISIKTIATPESVFQDLFARNIIRSIDTVPHGPFRMSDELEGIVETSNNLARVFTRDNTLKVFCLVRSAVNSARDEAVEVIKSSFELAGGQAESLNGYPGWKPDMSSPILKHMVGVYEGLYNKTPEIKVIHAGLECGLLGAVYPNWDMISFGPTIRGAHSPDERVHIESVGKFWEFLKTALKAVPVK